MVLPSASSPGTNGDMGMEVTAYTGSTTGTSRDNTVRARAPRIRRFAFDPIAMLTPSCLCSRNL